MLRVPVADFGIVKGVWMDVEDIPRLNRKLFLSLTSSRVVGPGLVTRDEREKDIIV